MTLLFCNTVGFDAHVDANEILPFRVVCSTVEVVRLLMENGSHFTFGRPNLAAKKTWMVT